MEKQTKRSYQLLIAAVISSFLHNAIFGLFAIEEPIFFSLTLLLFLAFMVSLFYNIYTYKTKGKPKDLWQLGWLGLLGLVGFWPRFGPRFYGLYGFFGFFGLKGRR